MSSASDLTRIARSEPVSARSRCRRCEKTISSRGNTRDCPSPAERTSAPRCPREQRCQARSKKREAEDCQARDREKDSVPDREKSPCLVRYAPVARPVGVERLRSRHPVGPRPWGYADGAARHRSRAFHGDALPMPVAGPVPHQARVSRRLEMRIAGASARFAPMAAKEAPRSSRSCPPGGQSADRSNPSRPTIGGSGEWIQWNGRSAERLATGASKHRIADDRGTVGLALH